MPKIVDREEKKKEIALIALNLFAEKGFDGTSISDIANEAGIAKGSVYDYFKSKDQLIFHALKVWLVMIEQVAAKRAETVTDPEKLFKMTLVGWMDEFLNDKRMVRLSNAIFQLLMSDKVDDKLKKDFYEGTITPGRDFLMKIFKDGVKKGVFKESLLKEGPELAVSIMAYLDGIGFYYHITKDEKQMRNRMKIYMKYLLLSIKK
ncbi:MAG: TetR/AcrR family transcriptional regulator [Elusimicrobiota bacterium]